MSEQEGDEGEPDVRVGDRFRGHQLRGEAPVFGKVSDRDQVTLADVLCRSLEFRSMLVAWKVIHELSARDLWSAAIKRRVDSIRRANPDMGVENACEIAERQIQRFRERYGDVVIGVYNDQVVSAYDVTAHERDGDGRVWFDGNDSNEFAALIGKKSPVKPWVRGQARPIHYIDTDVVRHGEAHVEEGVDYQRAVVGGYVLAIDSDGIATVEPPEGGVVVVTAAGASGLRFDPRKLKGALA